FLAKFVFQLDPDRETPAHAMEDGVDYVPTKIPVLFGHHFASIAGLGPILGPAVAVFWGWLPAVLWVILGCVFIGAVHDLGAMTVSLRFKGRSIGDVCQELIGPRARLLFLLIVFFLMSLAMGAFVNAISALFVNFRPDAIIPSLGLMVVAMIMGVAVYRLKVGLGPATVLGLAAFGGLIYWGVLQPVTSYEWFLQAETRQALADAKVQEEIVWTTGDFTVYAPPPETPEISGAAPETTGPPPPSPSFPLQGSHAEGFRAELQQNAGSGTVSCFILGIDGQPVGMRANHATIQIRSGPGAQATTHELPAYYPPSQTRKDKTMRFTGAKELLALLEGRPEIKVEVAFHSALTAPYGSQDAVGYLTNHGNTAAAEEVANAAGWARFSWICVLLGYGFVASVLPVWLLLQPRDYINSYQLYFALALLTLGLIVASSTGSPAAKIHAHPIRLHTDPNSPPMFPFLFVTIACGAVSGFHSLVSSGTTVRQLDRETDALPIGFGAMLTEGALAILVIMACVAGLGGGAWRVGGTYNSWSDGIKGGGLGPPLNAVIDGGANFLAEIQIPGILEQGIPVHLGSAFLAVTIVAFALTTLDSATRLLRFNVEEIFRSLGLKQLANRYVASGIAVAGIAAFGLSGTAGKTLWLMFGTTNQLLAGLTLLAVSLFLFKLRRPMWYTFIPMVFMLGVTLTAMFQSVQGHYSAVQAPALAKQLQQEIQPEL
ncbi:MAG: hypothetical protein N2C14_19600, partial [Planctomycetales bacterium]